MGIPEEEEHKKIINKNIKIINTLLTISVLVLLIILIFKNTNRIDKAFIYTLLFIQLITLYVCNIKWNQKLILYVHYLYCIIVCLSLFSNNIYILFYFVVVLFSNVYIWYINDGSCIFGGLDWGYQEIHNFGSYCFRVIPFVDIFKIFNLYRKSANVSSVSTLNLDNNSIESIIEKLPEKAIDETISFDYLHNTVSKTIKLD